MDGRGMLFSSKTTHSQSPLNKYLSTSLASLFPRPPRLLLSPLQPHNAHKHIVSPPERDLRPNIPMLPLPNVSQRQQNRDPTHHNARIIHSSCADRQRVREHVNNVEDDDIRARDGEDDRAVRGGHVELLHR
jgi:hypothetical protein